MAADAAAFGSLPQWHHDPLVRDTLATIRRCGWAVTAVGGYNLDPDEQGERAAPFAYTSGLALHSLAELAVYGLDPLRSAAVLNELGELFHHFDWRSAVGFGTEIEVCALEATIRVIEMINTDDLLITNTLFPQSPALQVVWSDDQGIFPWQVGYGLRADQQELKGVATSGLRHVAGPRTVSTHIAGSRAEHPRARPRRPRT